MNDTPFNTREYREELQQLIVEAEGLDKAGELTSELEKEYLEKAYSIVGDYYKQQ